jgi:4-oxalocrotonate tautomerase
MVQLATPTCNLLQVGCKQKLQRLTTILPEAGATLPSSHQPASHRLRQLAILREGTTMPFVNVKVIKGVFNADEKQEMISKLTETLVGIEGENMRGVTWVTVDEVESGDWGIGGQSITAEYVKELQAGRA